MNEHEFEFSGIGSEKIELALWLDCESDKMSR